MEAVTFGREPRPVVALVGDPKTHSVVELFRSVRGANKLRISTSLPERKSCAPDSGAGLAYCQGNALSVSVELQRDLVRVCSCGDRSSEIGGNRHLGGTFFKLRRVGGTTKNEEGDWMTRSAAGMIHYSPRDITSHFLAAGLV